jgi:hypothetical protein
MRIASGEHSRARFRAILRNGDAREGEAKKKEQRRDVRIGSQDPFRLALPSEI